RLPGLFEARCEVRQSNAAPVQKENLDRSDSGKLIQAIQNDCNHSAPAERVPNGYAAPAFRDPFGIKAGSRWLSEERATPPDQWKTIRIPAGCQRKSFGKSTYMAINLQSSSRT